MILHASGIQLRLNGNVILDGVDIDVPLGELIGLIGPNGAGKTSLLCVLANLLAPDTGTLRINRRDFADIGKKQFAQWVGYLEQGAPVYWPLRVRRLVELGRLPHLTPWSRLSATDHAVVDDAMRQAEVTHLAERVVSTLSGGERLRVLIARLFATQPTLILADEPIAALDPYHQIHTMELLLRHCRGGGGGVVVMHDLNTAARFCDRLVLIDHGRVIRNGTPAEVLTEECIRDVYGIDVDIHHLPSADIIVVPRARAIS